MPIRPVLRKVVEQVQKIQNGDEKESLLLVLDDEFFQFVRKVWDVALGELRSGAMIVDTLVDHEASHNEGNDEEAGWEGFDSEGARFRAILPEISLWHR